MNYDEALLTYIEVAVAFAGFAALVTAIRDRASGEVNPHLWLRLRGMVELALLVAAFSAGAISIRAFGVADEAAWRICSGLLAAAWPPQFLFLVARAQRLQRAGFASGSRPYRYFLYSIALLSTATLAANALGWWSSSAGAVYFTNLACCSWLPVSGSSAWLPVSSRADRRRMAPPDRALQRTRRHTGVCPGFPPEYPRCSRAARS